MRCMHGWTTPVVSANDTYPKSQRTHIKLVQVTSQVILVVKQAACPSGRMSVGLATAARFALVACVQDYSKYRILAAIA